MAETPISPRQSNPSAATPTEIYDCPDATTFVGNIYVANRSATGTVIRLSVRPDNAGAADSQFFAYDLGIQGNETIRFNGITVNADDRIYVYALLATCTFTLFGIEKT